MIPIKHPPKFTTILAFHFTNVKVGLTNGGLFENGGAFPRYFLKNRQIKISNIQLQGDTELGTDWVSGGINIELILNNGTTETVQTILTVDLTNMKALLQGINTFLYYTKDVNLTVPANLGFRVRVNSTTGVFTANIGELQVLLDVEY